MRPHRTESRLFKCLLDLLKWLNELLPWNYDDMIFENVSSKKKLVENVGTSLFESFSGVWVWGFDDFSTTVDIIT